MAGKRTASSELNHDNWDDYEPEEAGTFKKAAEDVLQHRVIKTARRRNPISSVTTSSTEAGTKNVFSSFGGFSKSKTQATASTPFAFLSNPAQSNTNGLTNATPAPSTSTSNNSIFKLPTTSSTAFAVKTADDKKSVSDNSLGYYAQLKGLNESVSQWIKTHVEKNPFCILTPIFHDYEKHLAEIDKKPETPDQKDSVAKSPANESSKVPQSGSAITLLFNNTTTKGNDNPFLSKDSSQSSASSSITGFNFGAAPKASTASGFSFGTGVPFTFSNVTRPEAADRKPEEEVEDEPPKAEFRPVVEDDSVFSKRCKVFVKKDEAYADRGVGQLFLKPVPNSEKTQLIVRADTNLGNLLLNLILSTSIPLQRMGKNNVMLMCIPTPDSKPPPTPVVLRVKTADEADELLKVLEKHQK